MAARTKRPRPTSCTVFENRLGGPFSSAGFPVARGCFGGDTATFVGSAGLGFGVAGDGVGFKSLRILSASPIDRPAPGPSISVTFPPAKRTLVPSLNFQIAPPPEV